MTDPTPELRLDEGQVHERSRNYGKVPAALMHDTRLTDGAIRLYAHMRWRYGNNHRNFEGRKSMAEMLGVSEKTISNRVKELEAAGWVVVVEREYNEKSGKYQTPYYHVFETRRSARLFRKTYAAQEGERIRQRPDLEERKTRAGVGGKPAHKPKEAPQPETPAAPEQPATPPAAENENRENSSSPGNSSSPVPGNSSSRYSDAGLSSSNEVKDSAPKNGAVESVGASTELQKTPPLKVIEGGAAKRKTEELQPPPQVPPPPPPAIDPDSSVFYAVAYHIFGVKDKAELARMNEAEQYETRIGMIASWLQGKKDRVKRGKKSLIKGFISRPAEPKHIRQFAEYQSKQSASMPLDWEKFIDAWRKWASATRVANERPVHTAQQQTELSEAERLAKLQALREARREMQQGEIA